MLTQLVKNNAILFFEEDQQVLAITEAEVEGGVVIKLQGALRSEVAHFLQDELDAFTSIGVKVAIDFGGVTFVAPSVLNALLNAQQLIDYFKQGEIYLRNIPKAVYQEMDDTGIAELLWIED